MKNTDDMKTKAKQALKAANTEEVAVRELTNLGLTSPSVAFSESNVAGQRMKMGMAYYVNKIIYF